MADITDYEVKFFSLFFFFTKCNVPTKYMWTMIMRYNHSMTLRQIARGEGVSYQAIEQRIKKSIEKIRRSGKINKFF